MMVEEWWAFVLNQGCVWAINTSNKVGKGSRCSEGKEHDRSGADGEG